MEVKPTSARMYSLLVLYDMHTNFFLKAIENISDEDAHNRLNTKANHISWLTGSLVQQRFEIAKELGVERKQKAHELFKDNKGIQDDLTYPPMSSYKEDWQSISPQLKDAFLKVSDEKLDASFEMMPGHNMRYFDLVAFIIYREANCIGQVALWRRLLGYPAMNYME